MLVCLGMIAVLKQQYAHLFKPIPIQEVHLRKTAITWSYARRAAHHELLPVRDYLRNITCTNSLEYLGCGYLQETPVQVLFQLAP